ncbi:Amino acid transporter AVT1I [Vitis vinifera]|uniref:Amino acid transporter AVT1I n=1 Tax=Vitis vinifera TaxID=29760 RepID=A0A438GW18_VITVI|nr:Amino acid transporter AVT1I [Vitis vinifera]
MEAQAHVDEFSHTIPLMHDEINRGVDSSTLGTTTFFQTCFNGLNALSGLLIQRCMDVDSNIRTYPDISERAFGNNGKMIVSILMSIELPKNWRKQSFTIIVGLIVLPSVWFDNMSILSYISVSGILACVIIIGSILWVAAFDGVGFHGTQAILNWSGVPTALSLYTFCFSAHLVFPTLYTSMKDKRRFSNALAICYLFCTITYTSMATLGCLMFGSKVQSQITLNLPIDKLGSRVAVYTTLISPLSKYALMVRPILDATENWFPCDYSKSPLRFVMKTSLVISTIVVALALPFFGYLMSIVGAFLSVTASILLPCLCYLKISGTFRRFGFELVIIGGIMLMSILVAVLGTYTSLVQLIEHL